MFVRAFSVLTFCALVCGGLAASPTRAQSVNYHILMNTSALTGAANAPYTAPFSLDFQFNDGGVPGNNTATLTHFVFGGGSAASAPSSLSGGASGSATGTVTIRDTSFFNELVQTFTPGQSLAFDLNLTTNLDSGPANSPDEFSFALLGNGNTIPTTAPNSAFVTIDVDSANPTVTAAGTASGLGFTIAAPTVTVTATAVPETDGALTGFVGIAGLLTAVGLRRVAVLRRVPPC